MNLVFLSPVGSIGGAERVLLHFFDAVGRFFPAARRTLIQLGDGPLFQAAAGRGVDVVVEPLPDSVAAVGDTQWRTSARGPAALLSAGAALGLAAPALCSFMVRLRGRLGALRPALVHSNGMKAHVLARLTVPRATPRLLHLHDFMSHRPLMRRTLPVFSAAARCGIAVSKAVADDVTGVAPSLPVAVVRNGVDTDHFTPGPADGGELDRAAALPAAPDGTIRIGLVGTYANWKGHDVFLQALAQTPGVRGYIVGGPIYATAGSQVTLGGLRELAAALGVADRVGFVPFQPDPRDVYRRLDIVVHASTRPEPFGLTIAEAMSVGRPVVAAAAGGALELFTPNVDALGHQPGNPDDLARQLNLLVRNPALRTALGESARRSAVARFSLDRFAEESAAVVGRVLDRRGRSIGPQSQHDRIRVAKANVR